MLPAYKHRLPKNHKFCKVKFDGDELYIKVVEVK
jgi:hypothetical protein